VEVTWRLLGGRLKPLVLWHLFWGPRSFADLMRRAEGISKRHLRRNLAELEHDGLVRKEIRLRSERRAEFALTPFGETLKPIVAMMYEWGLHIGLAQASPAPTRGRRRTAPDTSRSCS
jgi:DNA-binding HxlR family transcriptional regulator